MKLIPNSRISYDIRIKFISQILELEKTKKKVRNEASLKFFSRANKIML